MKQNIVELLSKQLKLKKEEVEKLIEIPPNQEMGDYAFPCFILSKILKKNPVEIALEVTRELNKKLPKDIEKVEAKGSYINFFVDKKILVKELLSKALSPEFGSAKEKQKILVEHTSVNPNASPHVGRARNSIIGDSIVRILKFRGNKVEIHYYVNDVSKQIAMLALIFKTKDKFSDMLDNYIKIAKKVENDPKIEKQVFEILEKFEAKDKKTVELFKKIVDICVNGQKEIFEKFNIKFDSFDYESQYVGHASKEILEKIKKTGKLFEDKDGRLVLDQSNTHLINKMKAPYFVLARSNGTGLYGLRDIAYTIDKMKHGRNIMVLGEDQKLYFEQVKGALKILGHEAPEVVHYSFVLLQTDEGAKKMSTRRGELVLLEEFYEESIKKAQEEIKKRKTKGDAKKIAVGAIKYAMLRNDNDKNIVFSWENSLNFEGESGPYLQYSYARASSILKKSKNKAIKYDIPELSKEEVSLIKKIAEFPEIVENAEKNLNPSSIANYSFQLAQIFNEFYHSCHVINDKNEAFRIRLVQAFRNTLKNSLYLLGIETMEEM
ncbi:MAG: arginine--tRNA ligase [Candidatus Pacearchaeota archaeon]|jgi:arginyl-tRNA synthetase